MFSIILKQILKFKVHMIVVIIFWFIGGVLIYTNRYSLLSFLYHLTTDFPPLGESNPKKAYFDFFLPAIKNLEEHNVDLVLMANLCPKELTTTILKDQEYEWHFLKKYNFFYLDKSYLYAPHYTYWEEKKVYVLNSLNLLKEAMKYSFEIPAEITNDKKNILIPYIIQQIYRALCIPDEVRHVWKSYIVFLEMKTYKESLHKEDELPYPSDFDLDLLMQLKHIPKYEFAIKQYLGYQIPFELINECINHILCIDPPGVKLYLNKLLFIADYQELGNLFLNLAKANIILSKIHSDKNYLYDALDYYTGAKEFKTSQIDAYLQISYLFLLMNEPEKSLQTLHEFKNIKPRTFPQESFYYDLVYRTLTMLKYYKEADCFKTKFVDTIECKTIRSNF